MNWEILANSKLIENLGWTLLHSLWQIALIAVVLYLLLRILRGLSANIRYVASIFALAFAFVLPVATFVNLQGNSPNPLQNEISTAKNAGQINENSRRPEDFKLFTKTEMQSANSKDGNVFASIKSFQNYFNENFPAVLPFVVGLWFFGVAFFAFRLIGGTWQLHFYKTCGISAPNADWQKRFSVLCGKLKINQTVKFLQSNLVETPIVAGWLKPVILVPTSVFLQISPLELETILAHELIHIRRFDCLINFAQSVVEVLFFYHPCMWWISAVIRSEREFAADEAVIKTFGASRLIYANALANLEEIRHTANRTAPSVLVAANGGNLMQRIQKILQKNTEIKRSASTAWSAIMALALFSAVLLTVFSFNSGGFVNAQTKTKNRKLAIGFVSIPPVDRTENPPKDSDATARLMIAKLTQYKIPAIGFVQGAMISDGEKFYPARADIVRLWRDAGFEIGIGGYRHIWFYNTPFEDYVVNTEKNERVTKKILAEKNLQLRYFSYPFLNTGKTVEERNRFENWLKERNLTSVKYTIDNNEWMYSYAYDLARNDNDISTMTEIRVEFINYISKMFDHYEAYSTELFGRDINQTMVLTPSRLVADSSDDLFGMIEKRGYKFVSMDEALSDEAYRTEENFVGEWGISWFERWAKTQGRKLRDEPKVSADVQKIWDENKSKK
ncbi:MAG: polysaccharide deacetylase family protein [Acidobacteriota bacterium]|nr:polysaccharide deacetylase family protein [Acidobacteriota bacterium]